MTRRSVQHRCVNMAQHHNYRPAPELPIPCPDCFSLIVTAEHVPYRPNEPWTEIPDSDLTDPTDRV